MSQNNVISFPKQNLRHNINLPTDDEMNQKMLKLRTEFFSEISDEIIDSIVRKIALMDLPSVTGQEGTINEQDVIILREAIIAMMSRLSNIPHPLHDHFEKLMKVVPVELETGELVYSYEIIEIEKEKEAD